MTEAFQVGDVVQLKSGGPAMTVTHIKPEPRGDVCTVWFDGSKESRSIFLSECLKAYEPPPKPGAPHMSGKPPIGVLPRYLWDENFTNPTLDELCKRQGELYGCIRRYVDSGWPIHAKWLDEWISNSTSINDHRDKRTGSLTPDSSLKVTEMEVVDPDESLVAKKWTGPAPDGMKVVSDFPPLCHWCKDQVRGVKSTLDGNTYCSSCWPRMRAGEKPGKCPRCGGTSDVNRHCGICADAVYKELTAPKRAAK